MEVGDRVVLIKERVYEYYIEMFKIMNFKNKLQNLLTNKDSSYKIFSIHPHLIFPYQILYGLEDEEGNQILVNGLSIKNIEKPNWKKPQKVKFDGVETFFIQTTGAHDKQSFEGIVYESRSTTIEEGLYSKNWSKKEFYKA